jgi:hypothetical protein
MGGMILMREMQQSESLQVHLCSDTRMETLLYAYNSSRTKEYCYNKYAIDRGYRWRFWGEEGHDGGINDYRGTRGSIRKAFDVVLWRD